VTVLVEVGNASLQSGFLKGFSEADVAGGCRNDGLVPADAVNLVQEIALAIVRNHDGAFAAALAIGVVLAHRYEAVFEVAFGLCPVANLKASGRGTSFPACGRMVRPASGAGRTGNGSMNILENVLYLFLFME
jgi:hypothetical protein